MKSIRVGDKVMGIMGVSGGYAGTVIAIKRDGRNNVVFYKDDDGVVYETLESNITKNVPEKGKFPRKNPKGVYTTYSAWRAAAKKAGAVRFEGDKDIAQAFDATGFGVAEWDGAEGYIYRKSEMRNPRNSGDDPSRDEMIEHIRKVYGREADEFDIEEAIYWFASDYHGGQGSNLYSALSTSEYRPGRMSSGPEEGSMGEMIYSDLVETFSTKKNPVKPRKGESSRSFVSRCMSEEKMSFPKTKQRIAVCLSKSRKRNPVYDTGSDE